MSADSGTVVVVDDDCSVREAIDSLLRSVSLKVACFDAVESFLASPLPEGPACLVLDVRLPGLSGLDLQDRLIKSGAQIPIIFITAHADVQMTVRAMKAGAVEFLEKPFREQDLLDAVQAALEGDRSRLAKRRQIADLTTKYKELSPRERQIFPFVVSGRLNKQVAGELGLSEITVKVHRGHLMRKMGAESLPDLVRIADQLGVKPRSK